MLTISDISLAPFLKGVPHVKQIMMTRVFSLKLPSFIIPKVTVVWHFKPSFILNQTWAISHVLFQTVRTLKRECVNVWFLIEMYAWCDDKNHMVILLMVITMMMITRWNPLRSMCSINGWYQTNIWELRSLFAYVIYSLGSEQKDFCTGWEWYCLVSLRF